MRQVLLNWLLKRITRLDVIDYKKPLPRTSHYVKELDIQLQDNNKTLKIFLNVPIKENEK